MTITWQKKILRINLALVPTTTTGRAGIGELNSLIEKWIELIYSRILIITFYISPVYLLGRWCILRVLQIIATLTWRETLKHNSKLNINYYP